MAVHTFVITGKNSADSDKLYEAFDCLLLDALRLLKGRLSAQEFSEASAAFIASVEDVNVNAKRTPLEPTGKADPASPVNLYEQA